MPSTKRTSHDDTTLRKPAPTAPPPETVDPKWLVRALALSLGAALLCAYLTACLLFYQGMWQLVLHPSHAVDRTPASAGLAFTPVRFGDFDTGQPYLTGWWVPAPSTGTASHYADLTVLYLHSSSGSLADTLPQLEALHAVGLNIFAIDYRGFGLSDASAHPDAEPMQQDADAALDYLISTRHVPEGSIVPYGAGLGASLAVQLSHDHPALPAVILDSPDPDPAATAAANASKFIPVRLLFGKRFVIAEPLATLSTPKLLIAGGPTSSPEQTARNQDLYRHAADPKYAVALPAGASDLALQDALRRFLDQYPPKR